MSSHSRSPSPPRRSPGSRSNSPRAARSRSRSGRSRSRTRSRSRRSSSGHYRRRTRSGSPRSRSPRSRSRSYPHPRPTKVYGDRENPTPSNCLGVFGLNFTTTERDLEREFGRYGNIESVQVVLDGPTKRSRGFAFIYFKSTDDAEKARDNLNGTEIAGFKIRVDFSITKAAHKPTPGVYFHHGKATRPGFRLRDGRGGGRRGDPRDHRDRYDDRDKYYDRRPPPGYYERGYDKYERDYYGPPRHRDERYYDYHRDPRDRERDRYYEDRDRHERDRYYEERDKYYDRRPPPGHYERGYEKYERDRGYDRYERDRYQYPSSSSRRSPSPGAPPPHRRDY